MIAQPALKLRLYRVPAGIMQHIYYIYIYDRVSLVIFLEKCQPRKLSSKRETLNLCTKSWRGMARFGT